MTILECFNTKNFSDQVTPRNSKSKFRRTSKTDFCEVCGKAGTDCGYNANEPTFKQCHTFVDARKGEKVNGFVCVKL